MKVENWKLFVNSSSGVTKVENWKFLVNLASGVTIFGFMLSLILGKPMIMTACLLISASLNLAVIVSRPGRVVFRQICREALQIHDAEVQSERLATHFAPRATRIVSKVPLLIWRMMFAELYGRDGLGGALLALGGRIKERSKVITPPLGRLDRIVRLLWSRSVCDRVFTPARADIVHEWHDAEIAGAVWRSRWIRYVRGPYSMGFHMLSQLPWDLLKTIAKLLRKIGQL
jgi:hypothetical protein